ncbi:MAG: M15 family metallopeptidase [Lawsonibacter sp.]
MSIVPSRLRTKLPATLLGICVCCIPVVVFALPSEQESELIPAVSALSPISQEDPNLFLYRDACKQLLSLGLTEPQAAIIYTRIGPQLSEQLQAGQLSLQTLLYLSLPNYHEDLSERYQSYAQEHSDLTAEEIVLAVNLGLDAPFYQDAVEVSSPFDDLVLVNKYHRLPADYVPELVTLDPHYGVGSLTPEAADAFAQMADAARQDGIRLRSVSAYRSYSHQSRLYRNYVAQNGQNLADTFSARPGYSEHQTGLALDINTASTRSHFEQTAEFAWLSEHCTQYGFLLRYPQGKESVTGYRFEPWHYRYVGVETAQHCAELGLTYDEYIASQNAPGPYALPKGANLQSPSCSSAMVQAKSSF